MCLQQAACTVEHALKQVLDTLFALAHEAHYICIAYAVLLPICTCAVPFFIKQGSTWHQFAMQPPCTSSAAPWLFTCCSTHHCWHILQMWDEELDEPQQQELQQQLFATELSQLPALVCLALETPEVIVEPLIAAATGRGTVAMNAGISRFPMEAQQALQQQLAGKQLEMLLRAAISRNKADAVGLLLAQPAAAELPADAMVQLLQLAMRNVYFSCGQLLVKCPAADHIPPADVAMLLGQALQLTEWPEDIWCNEYRYNARFARLMGLQGAQGIDTAVVVKLLQAAIAVPLPHAVEAVCELPAAASVEVNDMRQLLQQAVTADRTADYTSLDGGAYASYAKCVWRLGSLPAAQEVPVSELRHLLQQASDNQDGEMVAALLMALQEVALGLSSADVLQFLQEAVVMKNTTAATAAITQLGSLVSSSNSAGHGIQLQAEDLEQLLTTAMQLEYSPSQRSGVAESVTQLPQMHKLSAAAIARCLEVAVEHGVEGVVTGLSQLPNIVDVSPILVARLIGVAVDKRQREPASCLCSMLQEIIGNGPPWWGCSLVIGVNHDVELISSVLVMFVAYHCLVLD
jgi:hypothetical protein